MIQRYNAILHSNCQLFAQNPTVPKLLSLRLTSHSNQQDCLLRWHCLFLSTLKKSPALSNKQEKSRFRVPFFTQNPGITGRKITQKFLHFRSATHDSGRKLQNRPNPHVLPCGTYSCTSATKERLSKPGTARR